MSIKLNDVASSLTLIALARLRRFYPERRSLNLLGYLALTSELIRIAKIAEPGLVVTQHFLALALVEVGISKSTAYEVLADLQKVGLVLCQSN